MAYPRRPQTPPPCRILVCVRTFCLCTLLAGCSQATVRFSPRPSAEELKQAVEEVKQLPVETTTLNTASVGSLWPADDRVFLYGDKKALRLGDSVIIRIVESAQASNGANTNTARDSEIHADIKALFGAQGALAALNLLNPLDVTSSNKYAGTGTTSRQGQLTASITAVVREVLPNGNLIVQGSRTVLVNHEEQFITLTGMVRPQDIGPDNMIFSTQVADARISFGGIGIVADKQRSGWGTWIFDWVFPF